MSEKFDFRELLRYFSLMEVAEEVKLGKYTVLYLLKVQRKGRMEYFIFDLKDVQDLSDDEISNLVKSSPKYKSNISISRIKNQKYLYVRFNRFAYFSDLDMFTKTFLNTTKDVNIQRDFQIGKGWNPTPKLYKYVWWVFHNGVKSDNMEELMNSNECRFLNPDDAQKFIDELRLRSEPYAFVRKCYPRLGVKAFDYDRIKKEDPDTEFAPALEDDEEKEEILSIYEQI